MSDLYAAPIPVASIEECWFYHAMDIPNHGFVSGEWDLRDNLDEHFGHVDFKGRRVLEIGAASGFLTFEMERRGADVICVELDEKVEWDYVPYSNEIIEPLKKTVTSGQLQFRKSFWFAHRAFQSKAKMHYGSGYNLPPELGRFDIAILSDVLLHTKAPLQMAEEAAKFADTIIIADLCYDWLEGRPVMHLVPSRENADWAQRAWWYFTSDIFVQWLGVLGYADIRVTKYDHLYKGNPGKHFTVVGQRGRASSERASPV